MSGNEVETPLDQIYNATWEIEALALVLRGAADRYSQLDLELPIELRVIAGRLETAKQNVQSGVKRMIGQQLEQARDLSQRVAEALGSEVAKHEAEQIHRGKK